MNIDDLYKNKFSNFQIDSVCQDWGELNRKLKKRNFLRPDFMRFNIYYLLILFSFGAFASYSTVKNVMLHKKVVKMEHAISYYEKTIDSLTVKPSEIPSIIKDTVHLSLQPAKNTVRKAPVKIISEVLAADTQIIKILPDTAIRTQHVSIKKVKKTVYVKQQIIKKDTVRESD